MLSDLEARLEDLLSDIGQMPEEYVAKAEKVNCRSTAGQAQPWDALVIQTGC